MNTQLPNDPMASGRTTRWSSLGRIDYAPALDLQDRVQANRKAQGGAGDDVLLLLQHPPVLTLGRAAKRENVLASQQVLDAASVSVVETDRGGDVTYHGPGQIVGYPLLFLGPGRQDVRKYVRNLEEVLIRTLSDFSLEATRIEKWPGVWMENSREGGPRKVAAIGVHLSRWYTRHGFALNVSTNLSHFDLIVPCGIREASVTSIENELQQKVSFEAVERRIVTHFADVFDCRMRHVECELTPAERLFARLVGEDLEQVT